MRRALENSLIIDTIIQSSETNFEIPDYVTEEEYGPAFSGISKLFLLLLQLINGLSETPVEIAKDDQDDFGSILTLLLQIFDKPPGSIISNKSTPSQIVERPEYPGNPTIGEDHHEEDESDGILSSLSQLFGQPSWGTPGFPGTHSEFNPGQSGPGDSHTMSITFFGNVHQNTPEPTGGKLNRLGGTFEKVLPLSLHIFRHPSRDEAIDRPELGVIEKFIRLLLQFIKKSSQTTPVYNPNGGEYPKMIQNKGSDLMMLSFELLNELSGQKKPMQHGIKELSPFLLHIIQHISDGEPIDEYSTEWNSVEKLIILTLKIIKKLSSKFHGSTGGNRSGADGSGIGVFFPLLLRIINDPPGAIPYKGIEKLILLSLELIRDIFEKYSVEDSSEEEGIGKFVRFLMQIIHSSGTNFENTEHFTDDFREDEVSSERGGIGKLFLLLLQLINGFSETSIGIAEDGQDSFENILTLLLQIFDNPPEITDYETDHYDSQITSRIGKLTSVRRRIVKNKHFNKVTRYVTEHMSVEKPIVF
ncbi:hypothetical protein JTB14_037217 [Gonioctena quinquepunctata]|nr:hypothetical protein JTB14_037217 [Gonioctena quinquepunctata]